MMRRAGRLLDRGLDALRTRLEERALHRYEDAPFCRVPMAPASEYQRLWHQARQRQYPVVDRYEETSGIAVEPE